MSKMSEMETFITNFHNLEGFTIADKKRNFFKLLQTNSSLHQNPTLLDAIITHLTITTHLERLYYVDFLIYFRRYKELAIEFITGNDIVVTKISKERWFFEKMFEENSTDFVYKFLPTLSYALRIKVLKKLALILNEEQSDVIFDALHKRYGVFVASNILISCSCDKIEHVLKNHPIKLWTNQLKILCTKMPQLFCIYIEERVKHEGNKEFLNYDLIMAFVASKNPEMFCYLLETYKFKHCKVGKHSTKKIVRNQKNNVIAKPELYLENLNIARFVRSLGKDFEKVYVKIFPQIIRHCFNWSNHSRILLRYNKKHRFTLFKNTFEQTFSEELEISSCALDYYYYTYILELIENCDEREKWARLKLEHDKKDDCLKYFTAVNCLEIVRPKFNMLSQSSKRAEYVGMVTESCLLNKDWNTLQTVCELLCTRLKNDDPVVPNRFLETLTRTFQIFDNFNETHWKCIKEIMKQANSNTGLVMFKYFEFLYKNDRLTEAEMITLLKENKWTECLNKFHSEAKINKIILLLLIKVAPQVVDEGNTIENIDICLLLALKDHSKRHPQEKIEISDHPRLMQSIKNAFNKDIDENEKFASAIEFITCSKKADEELLNLYWEKFENIATLKLTYWFLKYRPDLVIANIEKFVNVVLLNEFLANQWYRVSKPIWRMIKCYSHLQMDQIVVQNFISKLNDDFDEKKSLPEALSIIMPTKDFIKLVETYKPTSSTVDLLDSEANAKFQLQRSLLKSFVRLNDPKDIISVIELFLTGDYVASCVSPLHSCLYRIPENQVKQILDSLCYFGAISVKKHGFYFICATQEESIILESIKSCHLSQSIAMAYQHFVKNPSQLSWELVKNKLTRLDNNDHFTSLVLVNTLAPTHYKAQYFETAFEIFRMKGNRFMNVLVDKVPKEVIGQLSHRFFASIKDEFLKMKKTEFIFSYYLLYCSEDAKYNIIFEALRLFKQQQWTMQSFEAREKLKQFINTFWNVYMEWDQTDLLLITTFMEGFQKIFSPEEAFEEFIQLALMKFKNQNMPDLSKSVRELYNNLINSYGKLIFGVFANCLNENIGKFYSDEINKLAFYNSLLDFKETVEDELLIINLLPKEQSKLKKSAHFYDKILDSLRKSSNETVQLHFRQRFEREKPINHNNKAKFFRLLGKKTYYCH